MTLPPVPVPVPVFATATKTCAPEGPPQVTLIHWLSAAEVRRVHVMPLGLLITRCCGSGKAG